MAVTLKDIAERTGVSPSVVSTVLSGRDNGTFVSDQTRRKVLQVAEMLNYTPVRSGRPRGSRRLRRQREEHFIGVWDPAYSPATAQYVQCLQAALHRHAEEAGANTEDDYGLRLLTADDLPRLDAVGLMGIVLLTPELLPREAAAATIPCVMLGEVESAPRDLVQIHADNFQSGRLLGDYLWKLGHRCVAVLAAGRHHRIANRRFQGLLSLWTEQGGGPSNILPVQYDKQPSLTEHEQVRRAVLALYGPDVSQENRPTALLCADEHVAAVAAQTLAGQGLRVPTDVSLAAFGDTPRQAESMIPPLTTVREPTGQLAAAAIDQLYQLHDNGVPDDPEMRDLTFAAELVVRASCGPASTGGL